MPQQITLFPSLKIRDDKTACIKMQNDDYKIMALYLGNFEDDRKTESLSAGNLQISVTTKNPEMPRIICEVQRDWRLEVFITEPVLHFNPKENEIQAYTEKLLATKDIISEIRNGLQHWLPILDPEPEA